MDYVPRLVFAAAFAAFQGDSGLGRRLRTEVNQGPFEAVPQTAQLSEVAALQSSMDLRKQQIGLLEKKIDHLLQRLSAAVTTFHRHVRIEDVRKSPRRGDLVGQKGGNIGLRYGRAAPRLSIAANISPASIGLAR